MPVVDRCVHLLGALRSTEAVEAISFVLQERTMPIDVVKGAILAAGHLALAHPREQPASSGSLALPLNPSATTNAWQPPSIAV